MDAQPSFLKMYKNTLILIKKAIYTIRQIRLNYDQHDRNPTLSSTEQSQQQC